jgi:hypothetical protein
LCIVGFILQPFRKKTPIGKLDEQPTVHPAQEKEPLAPWPRGVNPNTGFKTTCRKFCFKKLFFGTVLGIEDWLSACIENKAKNKKQRRERRECDKEFLEI